MGVSGSALNVSVTRKDVLGAFVLTVLLTRPHSRTGPTVNSKAGYPQVPGGRRAGAKSGAFLLAPSGTGTWRRTCGGIRLIPVNQTEPETRRQPDQQVKPQPTAQTAASCCRARLRFIFRSVRGCGLVLGGGGDGDSGGDLAGGAAGRCPWRCPRAGALPLDREPLACGGFIWSGGAARATDGPPAAVPCQRKGHRDLARIPVPVPALARTGTPRQPRKPANLPALRLAGQQAADHAPAQEEQAEERQRDEDERDRRALAGHDPQDHAERHGAQPDGDP